MEETDFVDNMKVYDVVPRADAAHRDAESFAPGGSWRTKGSYDSPSSARDMSVAVEEGTDVRLARLGARKHACFARGKLCAEPTQVTQAISAFSTT